MLSARARRAALIGLAAGVPVLFPPAAPARAEAATSVSSNWAGYAVTGARYRRVLGNWTVTRGTCTNGSPAYSAAWVGLGGYSSSSRALEQTGTQFNCGRSGKASYSAWYELVPASAKTIRMTVRPGNRMSAAVTVTGKRVTLTLRNRTTGKSFRHVGTMSAPDVSSAEWIVEAPSGCDSSGRCVQLPLSDFGTMQFSGASATTTGGHNGTISDSRWSATAIQLNGVGSPFVGAGKSSPAGASPSAVSSSGSVFSVTYQAGASSPRAARVSMPALTRPMP